MIRFLRGFVIHDGHLETLRELMRWTKYIVWLVHAYFVFAMKEVHSKITCDSAISLRRMQKSDRVVKYSMFLLAAIFGILLFARWIVIVIYENKIVSLQESIYETIFTGVSTFIKVCFDVYIYMLFFIMFNFFFDLKRDKLLEAGLEIPTSFAIYYVWGLMMLALNAWGSFVTFTKNLDSMINGQL